MGLLVDGHWHDRWYDTDKSGGRFIRSESQFRHWVTEDGRAGPSGKAGFKAEAGRYHLYVSYACPWAHRALIARALKRLTSIISVSVVHPLMGEHGWTFATDIAGATGDTLYQQDYLYQLYLKADPHYSGRVTVPVLWDTRTRTIVNNESADILRMLNHSFNGLDGVDAALDLYPAPLREQIDALNQWVYPQINNGVYKAGFATSQAAYDEAVQALFQGLDRAEALLANQRYLTGDTLTEADWRLFTTLVRFDPVYVQHFKCNLRQLMEYPQLSHYVRDLYQQPGVADTVQLDHIRQHYFRSHPTINPYGIVPVGPQIDYHAPHDRARFSSRSAQPHHPDRSTP